MVAVNFLRLAAMSQAASAATVYLAGDSTMAKNGGGSGTGTDGMALVILCKPLPASNSCPRMGTISRRLVIYPGS